VSVIGLYCLAVFAASLAVHLAAWAGLAPLPTSGPYNGAGFLHLAVLLTWLLAALAGCLAVRHVRRLRHCSAKRAWAELEGRTEAAWWPTWVMGLLLCYALGNGLATGVPLGEGQPERRGEEFTLESHGRVVRVISEAEYWRQEALQVRAVSGLWLMFSGWAALHVWDLRRWVRGACSTLGGSSTGAVAGPMHPSVSARRR
jgi:hypothetical protein